VTEAVVGVVTAEAVAVKVADVLPAGTVTDEGTLRAAVEDEAVTAAPPDGAAPDSVTVHIEVAGAINAVGVQPSAVTLTGVPVVGKAMVAPEVVVGIPAPADVALTPLFIVNGTAVADVVDAIRTTMFAMTPFTIALVLIPVTTQIVDPAVVVLHSTVFPAADAAGPVVTLMDATVELPYPMVHCNAAG
jgi:hypothetical protein